MRIFTKRGGGSRLVERYRRNYAIPEEAPITEQMVLAHWELERSLTQELRASEPEHRAQVFDDCYSRLYRELPWLNTLIEQSQRVPSDEAFADWRWELGKPPRKVYEIGAGKGELAHYLAEQGFICRAAEITSERGERMATVSHDRLSWGTTDGVHLTRFEPAETFDAVISDQVLEHLHPDDLRAHTKSVYELLRTGGSYLLRTPHRFAGPHDISRLFGYKKAGGMHLKEYTFNELVGALKSAGFTDIRYVMPQRAWSLLQSLGIARKNFAEKIARFYLVELLTVERFLSNVPAHSARCLTARVFGRTPFFRDSIFLAGTKRP